MYKKVILCLSLVVLVGCSKENSEVEFKSEDQLKEKVETTVKKEKDSLTEFIKKFEGKRQEGGGLNRVSRFYKSDDKIFWKLISKNGSTVEEAEVKKVTSDASDRWKLLVDSSIVDEKMYEITIEGKSKEVYSLLSKKSAIDATFNRDVDSKKTEVTETEITSKKEPKSEPVVKEEKLVVEDTVKFFETTLTEDPTTQTNSELTTSTFYRKDGKNYWELALQSGKVIEKSEVLESLFGGGNKLTLKMKSLTHDNELYDMFYRGNDEGYQLQSEFQNIDGKFGNRVEKEKKELSYLSNVEGSSAEDESTQTNSSITTSTFYQEGGKWYWTLRLANGNLVEKAEITQLQIQGDASGILDATSLTHDNEKFKMRLGRPDYDYYTLDSDFQSISGRFNLE